MKQLISFTHYLKCNNPFFHHPAVQQLFIGFNAVLKLKVVRNKVFDFQLAGAHPFQNLFMGFSFFALSWHLLVNNTPVIVSLAEINGDLFLFRHAVAQHCPTVLDQPHALVYNGW